MEHDGDSNLRDSGNHDITATQKRNLLRALSSTINFTGCDCGTGWYMNA
jgi:hypothetical protein